MKHARVQLRVSAYDRVASVLVSLLILVGFFVFLLFLIWLTRLAMASRQAVPVNYLEELSGRGENALGTARDLEEPGVEELVDQIEPDLEETLAAITDVVSTQQADLELLEGDKVVTGRSAAQGDSRQSGPAGEGDDVIPRAQRWQIRFSATNMTAYARQLDYFGIELAAVGGGKANVDYAFNLSKRIPDRKTTSGSKEKRLYMTWRSGQLQAADRELLARAAVQTAGRVVLQFYPPRVEQVLAKLEMQHATGYHVSHVREIRKTVYGVRSEKNKYEFFVINQRYRSVP